MDGRNSIIEAIAEIQRRCAFPTYEPAMVPVSPARLRWIRAVAKAPSHPNHEEVMAVIRSFSNWEEIIGGD